MLFIPFMKPLEQYILSLCMSSLVHQPFGVKPNHFCLPKDACCDGNMSQVQQLETHPLSSTWSIQLFYGACGSHIHSLVEWVLDNHFVNHHLMFDVCDGVVEFNNISLMEKVHNPKCLSSSVNLKIGCLDCSHMELVQWCHDRLENHTITIDLLNKCSHNLEVIQ